MKIKINYYMRSVVFLFLIFSSIFSISQSTYSLESENLNSENEILVCEKESISSYLKFSNYLDIDHKDLQSHMTLNLDDKTYSLIPLNDSEKYKTFFKKIFSFCDEEYMKFYGRGKCLSEQEAENDFQGRLERMWLSKFPNNMTFIIELDKECVGLIGIGPLKIKGFDPEISYIIDQDYCGKGIGYKGVKMAVEFLKYLREKHIYDFECLNATVHPSNVGSYKILEKIGFICKNDIKTFSYGKRKIYTYYF